MEIFPLLIPEDSSFLGYNGYLTIQGREYRFRLQLGPNKSLHEGCSIQCGRDLKAILRGHENTIKQRLSQSKDVDSFLLELKDILERAIRGSAASTFKSSGSLLSPTQPLQLYSGLITELQEIGWDRVLAVDDSLSSFQILLKDSADREHIITLKIPTDYPTSPPNCIADLPTAVNINWSRNTGTVAKVVELHEKALENFQDFWKVMDNIDQHTWVLEPEHPNRSATMRRLAIGNRCSLQIDVDPVRPRELPECRFWGADSNITPIRQTLNKNLSLWDHSGDLLDNLQLVLGMTFPSPQTTQKQDVLVECGICYSYRTEDSVVPDRVCDYSKCARPFHKTCLYDWLKSLSTSHQSYDTIFGTCPYCTNTISVSK